MSGSGSGSGGYTPMPSSEFNCIYGVIDTNLVSVDFELLKKYIIGDTLNVDMLGKTVVVENNDGEVLGSVLHPNLDDLKKCIEQGNEYQAEIIKILPTVCHVRISRKQ